MMNYNNSRRQTKAPQAHPIILKIQGSGHFKVLRNSAVGKRIPQLWTRRYLTHNNSHIWYIMRDYSLRYQRYNDKMFIDQEQMYNEASEEVQSFMKSLGLVKEAK
jgi:hypothetical protein